MACRVPAQGLHPLAPQGLSRAGNGLEGPGLVPENGQGVAPHGGGQGLPDHGGADCEAVLPVNVPDVQRHQGHLGIARPVQDAPHQADEAGAPALVSRLADQDAAAGGVVLPGAQGRQHLPCHQMGGIAHITVDVPQAQMGQIRAFLRQQYRVPAV